MEMAKYIMQILRTQIYVVFSWGFNSPKAIEDGLAFKVEGFLFKGRVEVLYDGGTDLFVVRLINRDGSVKKEQDGIFIDGLVDCIDRLVERCPKYEERIRKEYGIENR